MIRNIFFLLFICCSLNQKAFSQLYQYIDYNDRSLLLKEGWELLYTQEGVKITNFTKNLEGIAFSDKLDDVHYRIVMMDSLNQKLDEEEIDVSKGFMHLPAFYMDDQATYYGPLFKKAYELDWKKGKIKSYSNEFIRSKEAYLKQYFKLGGHELFNYIRKAERKKYFILLHAYEDKVDTLFNIADPDDMLYMQPEGRTLSLELVADYAYILNNRESKLYKYELSTRRMLDTVSLPSPNRGRKFPTYRLEQDAITHELYLINSADKEGNFWRVKSEEGIQFEALQIPQLSSMYHAKFHDGFMYNLFYLEDLNASGIYKKPLY